MKIHQALARFVTEIDLLDEEQCGTAGAVEVVAEPPVLEQRVVERQERAVHHVIQRGAYVEGDAVVNHGGANAADHILLHAVVMISHDDHAP